MQPQGHVQIIMNTVDFNHNPQAALDAPRWQWLNGKMFDIESGFPEHIARVLRDVGHEVNLAENSAGFGRGQIIWRDSNSGVLVGGTERRADGTVIGV